MRFSRSKQAIGNSAELLACDYLEKQQLKILARNYRNRFGEIDIIARDQQTIIFIEVKFRANNHFGEPYESVTLKKQQKIIRMAEYYLQENSAYAAYDCRFDVISVNNEKITWLKNAFDVSH